MISGNRIQIARPVACRNKKGTAEMKIVPMVIDALVRVVTELAGMVGIATPLIDAVLALMVPRAALAGCYAT